MRSEDQMNLKSIKVQKYWGGEPVKINYSQMDRTIIQEFQGTHPEIIKDWLPEGIGLYKVDGSYKATRKQKKHRLMIKFEKLFGIELSKKHYKLV